MRSQVEYMKTKDLGFDGDQVVRVALSQDEPDRALGLLRTGLSSHPEIAGATGASMAPGWGFAARDWVREGDKITTHTFRVDADFMATLGLELVSGRNLREDSAADRTQAVIINEALAQRLGWKDPVGRALTGWNRSQRPATEDSVQVAQLLVADPTVIGVVRDFHYFPVQARIEAVVLHLGRLSTDRWQDYRHALIRLQARDIPGGLAALKQTWRRIWPDRPLVYSFLSGGFASRYRSEERSTGIVGAACGLAVLIGLLGLYGMAAQAIGRRTKEIGIRKALGASVPRIVAMLTKEFTYLVLAANAIAWPIAWYAMHRWLQGFAYRIDLGPGTFLLGGALALTVAWLTVSWQAVRAATANPVDALRYE
jgi:putative ABC transport system permease protein